VFLNTRKMRLNMYKRMNDCVSDRLST